MTCNPGVCTRTRGRAKNSINAPSHEGRPNFTYAPYRIRHSDMAKHVQGETFRRVADFKRVPIVLSPSLPLMYRYSFVISVSNLSTRMTKCS